MEFTLEQLGLTNEELQQRIIDQICEALLWDDEDGYRDSEFARRVEKSVETRINDAVAAVADKWMQKEFVGHIESLTFDDTNRYGEKKGETLTFREYLVKRIDSYLTEQVDYQGKTRDQDSWSSWKGVNTRVGYMVDKYFHYEIENRLKEAVKVINASVADGLSKAVSIQIAQITENLKVSVQTKK